MSSKQTDRITTSSNKMEDETTCSTGSPTVLLTDPLGFIGSHIVQQLTQRGYKVRRALHLEKGTLDSYEKGTLDNGEIKAKIGTLKRLFPKLDLFEAGIRHCHGWMKITTSLNKMEDETSTESPTVVLVTDAVGFIGSHIVQQLTWTGYKVRGALDLEKGTLDSFGKGTLDNMETKATIEMLKGMFPKLDLFEAGIRNYFGWRKAVTGCSHVIHTSRFQDDKPAKEDDVTNLLQVCELVGGIKRVVLTGGRELISEDELRNGEWKSVNSALKDAICKRVSKKAALKFMGFQRGKEEEPWDDKWQSINSALKDAIYKYVSEKAAKRFMGRKREKPTFGLSIIKPPVVLGPILCELAEANVEIVRRRMDHTPSGQSDIFISVCDVRDVAGYHIEVMQFTDAVGIHLHRVSPYCLSLKDMTAILKSEFKDHGNWLSSMLKQFKFDSWDNMSQCLQELHGNKRESNQDMDLGIKRAVIDMAYSCFERGFIPRYRPREQERRYREETTDVFTFHVQEFRQRNWLRDMTMSLGNTHFGDSGEGNNDQLTSLKPDSESYRDDISLGGLSAPPEILARGPRAQRAYTEAAKAGKKKVFRTRLMLVGQERVGKTSLKKTLTGQGFNKNEAITDGVETTNACEISIEAAKAGGKMWSIHKKGHKNEDNKEDEYKKALADEIAKRLTVTPQQDQESFEPHTDTTLPRELNPEEAEDEYKKPLEGEMAKRLTVTPPQDQESFEPHSNTTLDRGLNPVEAVEFVMDNVEVPKAKEEGDNMPNQIARLVEKMLKEQAHLKEIGTDRTDSDRREGVSLSIWDFAGQDIYYSTHQIFLTWRAIYVIVFDLSRSLDSVVPPESRDKNYEMVKGCAKSELTCLEFINFWLCSIYAHAVAPSSVTNKNMSKTAQESPPIFIVGTHRESVIGDATEKKEKIGSAFEKIRESIMKRPFECHVVPKYYAIENSLQDKDQELVALRSHIEKVAMEEPYMGEEIPLRWLLFEEALAADKISYMSLDQTKELTQPFGIKSERELLMMLTFYHDLGYVVYYGGIEDQQSLLRDMVILNPQWLIDVFKQVITILDPARRNGIVSDAWTTLEKDGILEDRLIQHMWQGFLEQKEALVELMAKFDLICEAPVELLRQEQHDGLDAEVSNETEKVVKKRYYVPSRLTSPCPPEEIAQIKSSTEFYVDFQGFLPDGLFHRLMARSVRWMGERDGEPVTLFNRHISLKVDGVHHALVEMLPPREATIKVIVFRGAVAGSDHDGDSHKPPAPSAVKEVMEFVTESLDSLIQHWARRIKYDVRFLCPSPKCNSKILLKHCYRGMSLKCGLHNIPTAAIRFKFGLSEEGVESGNEIPISDLSSREMTAHTGPSTSAGIPVQDASADGAGSSPKASEHVDLGISEMELHDLAEKLGNHTKLQKLALKLGFDYAKWLQYKASNTRRDGQICNEGTLGMLIDWKTNTLQVSQKSLLNEAFVFAGFAELAVL